MILLNCYDCPATLEVAETPEAQRAAVEAGWAMHRMRSGTVEFCPKCANRRSRRRMGRTELGRLALAQMDREERERRKDS